MGLGQSVQLIQTEKPPTKLQLGAEIPETMAVGGCREQEFIAHAHGS